MSRDGLLAQWRRLPQTIRWAGVGVVGGTLIVIGVALLVLPGPGLVVIALGLVVLATEFAWAERTLRRMKDTGSSAWEATRRTLRRSPDRSSGPTSS